MNQRLRRLFFCFIIGGAVLRTAPLLAQTAADSDDDQQHPLATKQEIIRDRVSRLEDQMYRLIEKLKEQEPEQAKRLQKAMQKMGELGIRGDLRSLILLLREDARLPDAVEEQERLLDDFDLLLALLMQEEDSDEQQAQIEHLEKMLQELNEIIKEEQKHVSASQTAERVLSRFKPDAQAAAAIKNLIKKQQSLLQDTIAKRENKPAAKAKDRLASEQGELTEDARRLAEMLHDEKGEIEASKAAEFARQSMEEAQQELAEGEFGLAGDAQEDAIQDLTKALEKLTKKLSSEDKQPDFEELAAKQGQTGQKTGELAQEMQGDPESEQPEPTPGQPHVQQAKEHMDDGQQRLQQQNPANAKQEQQRALDELNRARRHIQQKLQELQQQQQAEKLEDLKKKFDEMLIKQNAINRATLELHDLGTENWKRPDLLRAMQQSQAEHTLGDEADTSLTVIREDGTTTVFPQLVEHVRDDMYVVARRLGESKVGFLTQEMQAEIVTTLEDILDVIEQVQNQSSGGADPNQQSSEQPGDPPLLPSSAELQLLWNLQERLFHRTKKYDRAQQQELDRLLRLAIKQKDVAVMAKAMADHLNRRVRPQILPQP